MKIKMKEEIEMKIEVAVLSHLQAAGTCIYKALQTVLFNSLLETLDMKMSRFPPTLLFCVSTLNFAEGIYAASLFPLGITYFKTS